MDELQQSKLTLLKYVDSGRDLVSNEDYCDSILDINIILALHTMFCK